MESRRSMCKMAGLPLNFEFNIKLRQNNYTNNMSADYEISEDTFLGESQVSDRIFSNL